MAPAYMPKTMSPPALRPPTQGLFTSAIEVVDADPHMGNGATWLQNPSGALQVIDPTCGATSVISVGGKPGTRVGRAIVATAEEHNAPTTFADLPDRARTRLLAGEQYQVENEFWSGVMQRSKALTDGGYLTDANGVDIANVEHLGPAGTTKGLIRALGALEDYLDDALFGAQGMIHCTVQVANGWWANNLLYKAGPVTRTRCSDTIVVVGSGYNGNGPGNVHTGNVYDGFEWAFATDLVWFWRGDILVTGSDASESLDRSADTLSYTAQRPYVVGFDGIAQGAVHIDLCSTNCSSNTVGS